MDDIHGRWDPERCVRLRPRDPHLVHTSPCSYSCSKVLVSVVKYPIPVVRCCISVVKCRIPVVKCYIPEVNRWIPVENCTYLRMPEEKCKVLNELIVFDLDTHTWSTTIPKSLLLKLREVPLFLWDVPPSILSRGAALFEGCATQRALPNEPKALRSNWNPKFWNVNPEP